MISNAVLAATFTLVTNGQIVPVDMVGAGKTLGVSADAVIRIAEAQGLGVQSDAGVGVVSVGNSGTAKKLAGFKKSQVVFVVEGSILTAKCQIRQGTPYISPEDLKRVAESMGWRVKLDRRAKVLALTNSTVAPNTNVEDPQPPVGDTSAAVCQYMDKLKSIWGRTEPTLNEKVTMRRLAADFQNMQSGEAAKDPNEVKTLQRTLKTFGAKAQRRADQTAKLRAPQAASGVKRLGVEFMDQVLVVVDGSTWITAQMHPDSTATKQEVSERIEKTQKADSSVQRLGNQFNREVLTVRDRHGCGPP